MSKNLNRRKFLFFNKKNSIIFSFIFFILILLFIIFLNKIFLLNAFNNTIQNFSINFNYQYENFKVTGLDRVDQSFIEIKLQKYSNYSIFLLPLNKIISEIKENNWIKNIKLSTNYKDTLFIDIIEYEPIGIYEFNNKFFYFDKNGKIIDQITIIPETDKKLIIFFGKSSNLKARNIINLLKKFKFQDQFKIGKIEFVQNRRWNILLKNNIILMLSEDKPKNSIQNFIKIINNLSETEINNIKYIDLRNIKKTLIAFDE